MSILDSLFGAVDDEAERDRKRAAHEAELARLGTLKAYDEEAAGIRMKLAVNEKERNKLEAKIVESPLHRREVYEVQRDALLRAKPRLEGRLELVAIARKRYEK